MLHGFHAPGVGTTSTHPGTMFQRKARAYCSKVLISIATYKTIGSLRVEKIYSIKMILIVTGQNLGTNYQTTIQTSQKAMGVQLKTERETVAPRVGPASDKKRAGRLQRKGVE